MCRLLLMTVAGMMMLFGLSGLYMMPKLIQQQIEQRMQLKIGTKNFDRFTKVPIPLTVKIYFFNISNSDKVLEGSERPKFDEVGPFMFKQWRRREIVDFLDHNRRLRYREMKTFYPMYPPAGAATLHNIDEKQQQVTANNTDQYTHRNQAIESSGPSKSDGASVMMLDPRAVNITIVNLPLLTALTTLAKLEESSIKRKLAKKIIGRLIADKKDKILMTRPANELLFDGTKVNFMESTKELISDVLGFNFDPPLPNNTFGFFYQKNDTWNRKENGELTVFTGRNDSMSDFMLIDNWNDLKRLQVWPSNTVAGDRCNEIRGTDGSQFHPGVRRDQVLELFSPLVCTSLYVIYKEDTRARDIPLLRFITPSELFAAPRKNPRNACYCTIKPSTQPPTAKTTPRSTINDSRCYLDGLMDLSLCQKGAPIGASSPHFFNGDPMLALSAGLKPNKDIHQTYLDVEPMTGSVFRAASRAQINAYVEQSALDVIDSSVIGNMTPMVAPIFWLEEAAEIDEKSALEFKGKLLTLVQKAHRSFVYSIGFGIVLALGVSLQYWYVFCYSIDMDELRRQNKERRKQRRKARERNRAPAGLKSTKTTRLGGEARHSNRESREKPILSPDEKESPSKTGPHLDNDEPDSSSASDTCKAAVPVLAGAVALGAASAGPSGTWRRQRQAAARGATERRPRSAGRRSDTTAADNEASNLNEDGCLNEEELSRRMLVENEWKPGTASNSNAESGSGTDTHNNGSTSKGSEGAS